ncbi:MAG: hypothetical protein GX178_03055 [Acidobacteria bacterium]|nr:hypothetical protein [Thermoanaerobaculia bacterium]MDI9631328.1 hypothetical protein [Acidobacteriota bacterium]MBP7813992.1 hypothetical protein [Thermoanaerobaculia bacterium]MBP8845290.1 hypothetical protein [Thermoanaerobaculia bacterium]NLN10574.1 hypothetical protein [Acidobacteriota bacterium]
MDILVAFLRGVTSLVGILISLGVMVLTLFLLGREHFGSVLYGLVRTLGNLLIAPFGFLRRLALDIAEFGNRTSDPYEHRHLYLLRRFLAWQQATILIVACVFIGIGVASSWSALLPDPEVLKLLKETRSKTVSTRVQLETKIDEEQRSITQRSQRIAEALERYRAEREPIVERSAREMTRLAGDLRSNPETQVLLQFLEREITRESPGDTRAVNGLHRRLRGRIEGATWVGGAEGTLGRWLESWKTKAIAEVELAHARTTVEDEYDRQVAGLPSEIKELRTRLQSLEETQARLEKMSKLKWGKALLTLGTTYITLFWMILLAGLLLELFRSWIGVVTDVRDLRSGLTATDRPAEVVQHNLPPSV